MATAQNNAIIRFGSGLFEIHRFGSVRFDSIRKISFPGLTPFGLHFSGVSWLGPVRFGSVPRPFPAGSRITLRLTIL